MKSRLFIYATIILVSFGIIGYSSYYLLGGFETVNVYQLKGGKKYVVGKQFTGRYTDKTIQIQFEEARRLVLDSAIMGTLAQIIYPADTLADNEVSFFTGVAIVGNMAEVPAGYEVRELDSDNRLAVFLSMHPLVRPSPQRIEEMLQSKADSLNMSLLPFLLELHYPDNSMSVEGYVNVR